MEPTKTGHLSGYIHRKGKKKFLTLWQRWFCILDGRLLLFYKSEEQAQREQIHDFIDLSLVYDVTSAPGISQGIIISTHKGPYKLRIREKEMHTEWLGALQTAVILKNVDRRSETKAAFENPITEIIGSGNKRVTVSYPISHDTLNSAKVSNVLRSSLNVIPGQNYSTYDGRKLHDFPSTESVEGQSHALKSYQFNVRQRMANVKKGNRPLSGSVSDFLLMTLPLRDNSDTKCETREKHLLTEHEKKEKNKKLTIPNPQLPTNTAVGKFLSLATDYRTRTSNQIDCADDINELKNNTACKDLPWNLSDQVTQSDGKLRSAVECAITCLSNDKEQGDVTSCESYYMKSDLTTKTRKSVPLKAFNESEVQDDAVKIRTVELPSSSRTFQEEKVLTNKGKGNHRRSSFATLKDFFFPRKESRHQDKSSHILEKQEDATRGRKNSNGLLDLTERSELDSPTSEKCQTKSAETSASTDLENFNRELNFTQQQNITEHETLFAMSNHSVMSTIDTQSAFTTDTRDLGYEDRTAVVLEVLEPEVENINSEKKGKNLEPNFCFAMLIPDKLESEATNLSVDSESLETAASWSQGPSKYISSQLNLDINLGYENHLNNKSERESRPALPRKIRIRRPPSPPYDIPRATCPIVLCKHPLKEDPIETSFLKISSSEQSFNVTTREMSEIMHNVPTRAENREIFLMEGHSDNNPIDLKSGAELSLKPQYQRGISHLVDFFNQIGKKNFSQISQHLSFANETVVMEEEAVCEL